MGKILMFFLAGIFLSVLFASGISAWEWDNVKFYSPDTKTVTVKNALGFGATIAEIKLDTPSQVNVFPGRDVKIAEFTINNYQDYGKIISSMRLYNLNDNLKPFSKDYFLKEKIVAGTQKIPIMKTVCDDEKCTKSHSVIGGYMDKEIIEWKDLDVSSFKAGIYKVGLFLDKVEDKEAGEWIGNFYGVTVNEWAIWNASLTENLIVYYNFDQQYNDVYRGISNLTNYGGINDTITFKLGTGSYNFSETYMTNNSIHSFNDINNSNYSYSFWVRPESSSCSDAHTIFQKGASAADYAQWGIRFENGKLMIWSGGEASSYFTTNRTYCYPDIWTHIAIVHDKDNSPDISVYVNGSLVETGIINKKPSANNNEFILAAWGPSYYPSYYNGFIDELAIWRWTLTSDQITQLWNAGAGISYSDIYPSVVTLNSPGNMSYSPFLTVGFNCSSEDIIEIMNMTLWIDGIENYIETGLGTAELELYKEILLTEGNTYDWTCSAYGGSGGLSWAPENRTLTIDTVFPLMSIVYPVNEENYFSDVNELNYTYIEDNPGYCWQMTLSVAMGENFTNVASIEGFNEWILYCNDTANNINFTSVTFFKDSLAPEITFAFPLNTSYNFIVTELNYTFSEVSPDSCWYSLDLGDTNSTTQICGENWTGLVSTEGENTWHVYINDTFGRENFTSVTFSIDTLFPSITINLPLNITYEDGVVYPDLLVKEIELNWTIEDLNLDSCWLDNGTGIRDLICGDNISSMNVTYNQFNSLIFYANDTFGNQNFKETNPSYNYTIKINERIYNLETYETAPETFLVNFTYDSNRYTGISSSLVYDEIFYIGTKLGSGDDILFSRTIDAPTITEIINKSFYWNFLLTNTTGSISSYDSDFNNQTINPIILQICNATYNVPYINFTIKDEKTDELINSSFAATFSFWAGTGNFKKSYSFSDIAETRNYFDFCAFPSDFNLTANMDSEYSSLEYPPRTHYLKEASLSNATQNINLFLLNKNDSIKFFFTLTQSLTPVANAIVIISKYEVSTGTYNTVGIRKTDTSGKFIEYLELDKEYQFSISKDGQFLGIIYKTSTCSTTPCEIELELITAIIDLWSGYYDVYATNVAYNLTYNPATKLISFIFSDLTGLAQYFRLQVNHIDYNQSGAIIYETSTGEYCNKTLYTTAGTITCNLTGYTGQFRADAFISRSPEKWVATIYAIIATIRDVIGREGLLFTLLLVIVVGLIGAWNPVVGIILAALAMFFSMMLGFISISYTAILLIFILAIFLIVKMGRGGGV